VRFCWRDSGEVDNETTLPPASRSSTAECARLFFRDRSDALAALDIEDIHGS
jgi:hypothetical protein